MMNIVQAKGSKTVMEFFGSSTLESKFNFTAQFLTSAAWACQQKYDQYEFDPYVNR